MGEPRAEAMAGILTIVLLWGLIGLGFFLWYLFAMSRLFPKLGLESWEGWIPLWNEWRLIDRAGLPGWIVLSYLLPGLGIVAVVMRTIAMHRVGSEAGVGSGYTVLGVVIPPLWATLLSGVIGYRVLSPEASGRSWMPEAGSGADRREPWSGQLEGGGTPPWSGGPGPWSPGPGIAAPVPPPPSAAEPLLGTTTEREFERLAAERQPGAPAVPLGLPAPPAPFSWPGAPPAEGPSWTPAPPLSSAQPSQPPPPQPPPPPVHPLAGGPRDPGSGWPGPAGPSDVSDETATAERAPRRDAGPPSQPRDAPAAAPGSPVDAEDDLDLTVVVRRAPRLAWVLELPDGERLDIAADTVVGRRPAETEGALPLVIPDLTRTLSKSHARLRFDGEAWSVEDLGSTNGLVLIHDDGQEEELVPGRPAPATERMLFGTLSVRLIRRDEGA